MLPSIMMTQSTKVRPHYNAGGTWRHVAARVPVSNSDNKTSRQCNCAASVRRLPCPRPASWRLEADGRISRFINT